MHRPKQKRSRKRQDHVLETARSIIAEEGLDALTMSVLSRRSGVAFGSLYQYFPSRSAVLGKLAEIYFETLYGRYEVLTRDVSTPKAVAGALSDTLRHFFGMVKKEKAFRDVWLAVQSDPVLRELEAKDNRRIVDLMVQALVPHVTGFSAVRLQTACELIVELAGGLVRHAVAKEENEQEQLLEEFDIMARAYFSLPEPV